MHVLNHLGRWSAVGRTAALRSLWLLCLFAGSSALADDQAATGAIWQESKLDFHYFGTTTYYSCSGLEHRLEQVLRDLGAAKDVHASATGCFGPADTGNMLNAQIRVRMPQPADAQQTASVQAMRKVVSLKTLRNGEMGAGDCELLEQVRDQLLPALKLKLVKDNLACVPGKANTGSQNLLVEALLPVAEPAAK